MFCVHLCLFLASVTTYVLHLNFYFKSYFSLFISDSAAQTDRVTGTEQRVGVMGNDRIGRGKYQSEAHCSRGLWSCCSEAPTSPRLLSAHQGQVPAYPRWNTASNSPGSLLSQTECRLLSQRRLSNKPHTDGKV